MIAHRDNKAEIKYYAAVQEREVDWLWYPYIPYGKITLLQGDPGDGKSTFMLHLAAVVSKGGILPDGSEMANCGNVIYQCSEDSVSDTIKPRLIKAGADCDRIAFIDEDSNPLTFDDHRVEEAIRRTKARLVIFDPIQAYIPADGDMINAAKMRGVMKQLAALADKYACAIVLIGHMNKTAGGKNLYRGLGSIDIAAAARSVLMIKRDEAEPDIRYIFPVKSSLAYEGSAIRFMFNRVIGFQILGICDIPEAGSKILPEETHLSKAQNAERLLKLMLTGGSLPSKKILEHMKAAEISERTVRTAVKNIGVKAFKKANVWYWKLDRGNAENPDQKEGRVNGNQSNEPR